jgi:hypothetical protein
MMNLEFRVSFGYWILAKLPKLGQTHRCPNAITSAERNGENEAPENRDANACCKSPASSCLGVSFIRWYRHFALPTRYNAPTNLPGST